MPRILQLRGLRSLATGERRRLPSGLPAGRDELIRTNRIQRNCILVFVLVLPTLAALRLQSVSDSVTPDEVKLILQRSVEAGKTSWKAAPGYEYVETDVQKDGGTKTFAELMILGSPYERLIAIDGKPLSPDQEAQEQKKLTATISRRRNESPEERNQRLAKYEKIRKRDRSLMEEFTKAFDFACIGEQEVGGREAYVLEATPRPGYQPPNRETEVLKGTKGRLWIDKQSFNWVKAEAEVIKPVPIVGFLARVEPGTHFELDAMPISNDIWLPSHFSMKTRAKVLLVFSHESEADESYYGYHGGAQY